MKARKVMIAVTPQVYRALTQLHRRGLHGFSIADVTRRLADDGIRRAFVVGEVDGLMGHAKVRARR